MIDGDWRVGAVAPLLTKEEQENFELTVLPDIEGQVGPSSSTSGVPATGFGMKKGLSGDKADAAWKWISFFAGPEAAEIRLLEQGLIPSYKMDLSVYTDLDPLAVKRGAFYAEHPLTYVLDDKISGDPINIMNDGLQELALGNTTPEKLAADIQAAWESQK
jgi:raffinose/stachyose/melibiose transport system substrate-binding protein